MEVGSPFFALSLVVLVFLSDRLDLIGLFVVLFVWLDGWIALICCVLSMAYSGVRAPFLPGSLFDTFRISVY